MVDIFHPAPGAPKAPAATSSGGQSGDALINQALSGGGPGGAAGPAPVPGYSTSPTATTTDSNGNITVTVGSVKISLDSGVDPNQKINRGFVSSNPTGAASGSLEMGQAKTETLAQVIQEYAGWSSTQKAQFKQEGAAIGLFTTKTPTDAEMANAWARVVQDAAAKNTAPEDLIQQAAQNGGYAAVGGTTGTGTGAGGSGLPGGTPSASNSSNNVTYLSYLDPATVQGVLADSIYRLLGRNPTPEEYQSFLNSVYGYQSEQNRNILHQTETDKSGTAGTGGTDTSTTGEVIRQNNLSSGGVQYMAAQQAYANPDYGRYQAATTYFNAFMKALSGPASGMTGSGPTNATQ